MNRWLNYHQLVYFRAVARAGSLAAASVELRLSPQTLSEHIQQLEAHLGATLFVRGSRGMTLTERGRLALLFADQVFSLGQELFASFEGGSVRGPSRLAVGVDDTLPRLAVWDLLRPGVQALAGAPLVCRTGDHGTLLDLLRAHVVDLVLSGRDDLPEGTVDIERVTLRESPVSWVAADVLADRLRDDFPRSLDGAPVVIPAAGAPLRRALDVWCERVGVRPHVVVEASDSALAKTVCAEGIGAMALPADVFARARERYGLREVGPCEGVTWRIHGYTTRRLRAHAGVEAVLQRPCDNAPHEGRRR
jgi:LysR family transcriptional activator of nhaA